ncbi:hypothetical protein ACFVIM_15725 [Streptomyces sp. NPDC057638]|uniref:SCO2583 family membrane protein n=1 Tax=Streptomyces sp. NPDC057638 TaxID=3346190 RepID=UPI0036855CC4
MAGHGDDPPDDGSPEDLPGGGEDEYRSVVFDESFVRAARLQEFSAQERMGEHARAVRTLPTWTVRSGSKAALLLVLMVVLAFGAAIYLGVRSPYQPGLTRRAEPLRITVIPLAPQGAVPGGTPADLYAHGPAAQFRTGASGITLPGAQRTENFSGDQVMAALTTAKDYLVESSLNPQVLTGRVVRPVRILLDPDQFAQFDRSMAAPSSDGRHAATGWLVRYDPAKVTLADTSVRVRGTLTVREASPDVLEVTSDHTFAYTLRPAVSPPPTPGSGEPLGADRASFFTVRRELRFRFDRDDLHYHRVELVSSRVQAGPQSCSADTAGALRPLLAGERAGTGLPAGTDPYAMREKAPALCGALSPSAQPSLPRGRP